MEAVKLQVGDWRASVVPAYGANVTRLQYRGEEVLRTPASPAHLKNAPCLYGTPLLMPPNRTKLGRFSFDGASYQLPINEPAHHHHIHGQLADAPFAIIEQSASHVVCAYQNEGERYPFRCRIQVVAALDEGGLRQQVELENTGEADMPAIIGFHTAFTEPVSFAVPIRERWEADSSHIPTGRLLALSERERAFASGCPPEGSISGYYTAAGHEARVGSYLYRVSEHFTEWVLYNGGGDQGFLCVEPQSGPVDGLNRVGGYRRLRPGERLSLWTTITRITREEEQRCQK